MVVLLSRGLVIPSIRKLHSQATPESSPMPSNPKQPSKGDTDKTDRGPGSDPRQPRFDDRPEPRPSRSGEGKDTDPNLPRYGDTERDDPRRSHTEATPPAGDVDDEGEDVESEL